MPFEIMVVSVIAIIFGVGLVAFVLGGIYKLIKAKIDQGSGKSSDINPQFFKALSDFKKNTERRITNLEAIVSDLEEDRYRVDDGGKKTNEIEIEDEEVRSSNQNSNEGNLRNMLNE
ncbi:MAG: hypothetical protein WD016_10645 [Balneolaceae bacterium]